MSVVASEIVVYASANMPDTDSGTNGGAIDGSRRLNFAQIAANDTIQAVSSSGSDTTQTVTVEARKSDGSVVSETKTLTGTSAITFSTLGTVERILKVELSATCAGNVTVRRSTGSVQIGIVPAGERGFMAPFRKTAADPSNTVNYYTKCFVKNNNGSFALLNAVIKQAGDPSNKITHLLANAVNDSATSTNRVTAPATSATQDPDTFNDTDKSIPGTDLASGAAIGVWLRLQLTASDVAYRSTYTLEVDGQTA